MEGYKNINEKIARNMKTLQYNLLPTDNPYFAMFTTIAKLQGTAEL